MAVYVVDMHGLTHLPGYTAMSGLKDNMMQLMHREGGEIIEEIEDMAWDAGVAYERAVAEGDSGEGLLTLCSDPGSDLIAMGAIGRGSFTRFLLGSVAEKVVRHSHVSVLVVPVVE